MANDQNQNKSEKDYDSMSREELLTNFYALTKKPPMKALQSISEAVKNGGDISITNALFGDSKKGVKIKKVGRFGKLFRKKDKNNEPILKENEITVEKVNEAKACFNAYIKKLVEEKNLFPDFTINEKNTEKSSNHSFSSWIKNAFKYKNQKITGSNKQVKKDFFNNFFKNKESVDKYQSAETKDFIKILEKQLNKTIQTMRNIKVFKNPQSEIERESNKQRAQTVERIKRQIMKINNLKEQLEIRETLQQADAYIAREKAELQKEVDKLKMGAKKHPKQKELLDGIQQLIDKDFKAPAQEKQEMDKKPKQVQKEIKKESNGMTMADDRAIDEEFKRMQEETQKAVQQADAHIAREKAELQKETDKLKMGAKKHPKQKELLDGVQQLIDKDFEASAQERQEMDKKSKQAQEEIKKESQIKIGQINNMMMADDESIDKELKQMEKEIEIKKQSKKGNDIDLLTRLNRATLSANVLTPRSSQVIGH